MTGKVVGICPKHGDYNLDTGCWQCDVPEKPFKIAVYGICKNEEKHIRGWVERALSEGADYIVVTDTGSTDGTIDILKELVAIHHRKLHIHKANIVPFRFDIARNCALANVPLDADLCISIDIDEHLRPGWRANLQRVWETNNKYTRIWVHFQIPNLTPYYHNDRIHSRRGYRWVGPCHETIEAYGVEEREVVADGVWIEHHPDDAKPRNYIPLLAVGVKEEPNNLRRIFYYGRDLMCHFRFQEAIDWLSKYMELWEKTNQSMWEEPRAAKAMIELCRGAMKELAEGKTLEQCRTLNEMDRDTLGIISMTLPRQNTDR